MTQDGRRLRGERTRQTVAHRAAELATIRGLSGLTIGQLADDMGLGKSSVAAAYGTKQNLQLAAIASARETFIDRVIRPVLGQPPGLPRLMAMIDAWLAYVELPVFPGGCFLVATAAEFDSQPGPVRDRLRELRHEWLAQLTAQVERAQADGAVTGMPAALVAFEIDAILAAASISRNMRDDDDALAMARQILRVRLTGG